MQIIRRPAQYSLLAFLVLLAIPIFVLNIWIIQKGVTQKVLKTSNLWWIAVQAVWVLATLRALLKAKWIGFWSFQALSVAMLITNVILLVTMKNYALAFYALFLLILSGMYSLNLFRNLSEPYYDSGQQWFEGTPPLLPHVESAIVFEGEQKATPLRLSRLGVEGCYAFAATPLKFGKSPRLALKLGEHQLVCGVESISTTGNGRGWGLRFVAASADEQKDIRDFIDRVRSMGYVA